MRAMNEPPYLQIMLRTIMHVTVPSLGTYKHHIQLVCTTFVMLPVLHSSAALQISLLDVKSLDIMQGMRHA